MSVSLAHNVLDALPDMAPCLIDGDGVITAWYQGGRRLLGYRAEDLVGQRRLQDLIPELASTLPAPGCYTVTAQHSDGHDLRLELVIEILGDDLSGLTLALLRGLPDNEITARLTSRDDNASHSDDLFDVLEQAVIIADIDGTVLRANRQALRLYGPYLIGKEIGQAMRHRCDPSLDDALRRVLARFSPMTLEQRLPSSNRSVRVTIRPLFNRHRQMRGLSLIEQDVTDQRLLELEIRLQHQQLQDRGQRLRSHDQTRRHWLTAVSHELRTPLTSIRSYSELLLAYPDTEASDRREFLGIIVQESERLGRLINDILDLAHIESGRMAWHPVEHDMTASVDHVVEVLRPQIKAKNLSLSLHHHDGPCPLIGDRDRLRQVLLNICSNAIKFSPQDGTVIIDTRHDERSFTCCIEDDGPGIPDEDRELVFDFFSRRTDPDQPRDPNSGTGLGLAISRQIVQHHGGELLCDDPHQPPGARFTLRLPRPVQAETARFESTSMPSPDPS